MGVPKFFRWLYERYPCLCEVVREYEIPEFDNLYLDMNGIIHICSHPNDFDPHFRISEEKIFKNIFHYIEILFRMIQPQKLFFMAVDGVAPRAKLNQQRGRRFRTAKEAVDLEKKAVDNGVELPKEKRFDSNCITPGTEFMEKLHHQLRYFIAEKMTNDKLWKNVKVILSGHETPGEGEHKIMDYIRYMKAQPDYDHNTRHCLYGLDADLIMLGLCTHEPHFSLLREEVKFGKKANRTTMPEDTKYYLLHLSLMRGYLDWEFSSLKDKLPFGYNLENIIDDWVLMGFLVGNDFIPHLPGLHIAHGALQMLHKAYMDVLPTLDGYINEGGTLVLSRFQRYLEKLAAFDIHQFKDEFADLKYFTAKTGRRMGSNRERPKFFNMPDEAVIEESNEPKVLQDPNLQEMIKYTEMIEQELEELSVSKENKDEDLGQLFGGIEDDFHEEDDDDDDEDDDPVDPAMFLEFCQKKRDYYTNKLEFEKVTPEVLQSQAEGYVRAIQWNLHYYYDGVCSWSWFYPHHYAPYISDIKNFCNVDIKFDMGKPFLPFQQLLAVLPSLSKNLLPETYHSLMENESSPIIDYYPSTFQTDLNGKRQEWEAVVLIPFIDEVRLLEAMEPLEGMLTEEEKRRNKHGPMLVYTYSGKSVGSFESPFFPIIENNHALEKRMTREEIYVPQENLKKGLCSDVLLDVHIPGFPFLRYVPHKAYLEKAKVKVFDSPSHGESMILEILTDEVIHWKKDTAVIAKELLGRTYQVSWPHLYETKIIEVLDSKSTYSLISLPTSKAKQGNSVEGKGKQTLEIQPTSPDRWRLEVQGIKEEYGTHLGIKLGPVNVVVRALPMSGRKYAFSHTGTVSLEKQWSNLPKSFALQTVVKDIKVKEPKYLECNTIHEMFPPKTIVFLLGNPHYGSMGKVTDIVSASAGKVARVKIAVIVVPEPDMECVKAQVVHSGIKYYPGGVAAKRVGISGHLLSRVTGTIYVMQNEMQPYSKAVNIGLSLKFNKKNEEVPGFTKKDNNSTWLYSDKCIELLSNYIKTFPELFGYLSEHTDTNEFQEALIFPESKKERSGLKDVVEWLSQQAHTKVEHRRCGVEVLEDDIVQAIEKEMESVAELIKKGKKTLTIMVQPHLIHKPGFKMGYMQPDDNAKYLLYDRVVNVRECFTVPLGLRGTVVGIQRASRPENTLYDIVFDSAFEGGASLAGCSHGKGYRLPGYALVNLSHGIRCSKYGNPDAVTAAQMASKKNPLSTISILPSGNLLVRHPNHAVANSSSFFTGGRVQNAPAIPDRPASAFASWRGGCTGFGPNYPSSSAQPQNDSERSPISNHHQRGPPKIDSAFKGKDPVLLRRPAPEQATAAPPAASIPTPQVSSNCSVEFQAMWKELQKPSSNVLSAKAEVSLKPSSTFPLLLNANQLSATDPLSSDQTKSTETDFLKKILRIDGNSSSTSQTNLFPSSSASSQKPMTSPLQEISQPSVQDFFEKAKAVTAQQHERNQKGPVNYCLQLISMYQRTGQGIPRYDYIMMDNGMVTANLSLPNGVILQGDPAPTNEKASENVAKLAIGQMSKWMKGDMQYGGFPMPANKLPAPPQQWYQSPMSAHQPPPFNPFASQQNWQGGNMYQKLNWREHTEQTANWQRRQNQWQNIRPPPSSQPVFSAHKFVPPPPTMPFNPFQQPPQANLPQAQFSATHVWRPSLMPGTSPMQRPPSEAHAPTNGSVMTSNNPFIPLQAVRAQMSANSSSGTQNHPPHDKQKQSPRRHQVLMRESSAKLNKVATVGSPPMSNSVQLDSQEKGKGKKGGGGSAKASGNKSDVSLGTGGELALPGDEKGSKNKEVGEVAKAGRKGRDSKQVYVPPHARKSRLAIKFGADE